MTIVATNFCEVASLHPNDMEVILSKNVKLRRRLHTYGVLKAEMQKHIGELQRGERVDTMEARLRLAGLEFYIIIIILLCRYNNIL